MIYLINYIHLFEMRGHYKLEYMIYPTMHGPTIHLIHRTLVPIVDQNLKK